MTPDPLSSFESFKEWLRRTLNLNPGPVTPPDPISPRVLMITLNPVIPAIGSPLRQAVGWNDPNALADAYIDDLRTASFGYANYQIVERAEVDLILPKVDGYVYTPDFLHKVVTGQIQSHDPDLANYRLIMDNFHILDRINANTIDEVWLFGHPWGGFRESRMGGPNAINCNGEILENTASAAKRFVIMGFSYQTGVGEMLEDFGHRAEAILGWTWAGVQSEYNLWQRFNRIEKTHPGQAEVGTVHLPPNSETDYTWNITTPVLSRCRNWQSFPDLSGAPVMVDCSEFGCNIRGHHQWWLRNFPHIRGGAYGVSYNWWQYIVNSNNIPLTPTIYP